MKKVLLLSAGLILSAGAINADYDRDSGPYWEEEDVVGIDAGDRKYDPEAPGWWAGYHEHHWKKHHAKKPKAKADLVTDAKKAVEDAEKKAGEITDANRKAHAENALAHAKLSLDQLEKGDEKDTRGLSMSSAGVKGSVATVNAIAKADKSKKHVKKEEEKKEEKKPEAKKEEPKKEEKKSEAKKEEKKS